MTRTFTHAIALGRAVAAFSCCTLLALAAASARPVHDEPATLSGSIKPTPSEELAPNYFLYRQHVMTLANPFFEGRAPGTNGNRVAADYLEFHSRMIGLQPAFPATVTDEDGNETQAERASFRQVFVAPFSSRPGDSLRLKRHRASITADGAPVTLRHAVDYSVLGPSANAAVSGQPVFVGYSIDNARREYTTYTEGVSLEGKIAIVMRFEPINEEGKSRWADLRWSAAANLDPKLAAAEKAGAAGIILVNPPGAVDERMGRLEDLSLTGSRRSVPLVMMSAEAADRLVRAGDTLGRSLADLRALADEAGTIIDLPNTTVSLDVEIERVTLWTDNVGAILPGKGDLADQFIVIGSHYDHVGYGYFGSRAADPRGKIHVGADDNASGTSGVLLTAKRFAQAYDALPDDANARSILFLWFSAEESGLVGSRHYARNPIVPMSQHAMMINMDMIGRLRDNRLELGGVGTAEGLEDWLQPYISESGLVIKQTRSGFGPSDHASFTAVNVPTLFFFTQLHSEYHTPADTADTINVEGAVQVADLAYRIAYDAALRPEPFVFSEGGGRARREREPQAATDPQPAPVADPAPSAPAVGGLGTGVRFGIAPGDYSGDEPGVLVGEVFPDLPAEKAGLKEGDRMIKWNNTALTDVESWMPLLTAAKPGDVVTIVYVRDGKEMTTQATLIARARRPGQ
ncbi:MAG: M28 family peptidase [Phycisphaeraceae bacterium]|nr:M28 family peptidase [Phycisphaeraceae bacterium]